MRPGASLTPGTSVLPLFPPTSAFRRKSSHTELLWFVWISVKMGGEDWGHITFLHFISPPPRFHSLPSHQGAKTTPLPSSFPCPPTCMPVCPGPGFPGSRSKVFSGQATETVSPQMPPDTTPPHPTPNLSITLQGEHQVPPLCHLAPNGTGGLQVVNSALL